MGRWLERLWFLALFSLTVHLGTVVAMKRFVPPPLFALGVDDPRRSPTPLKIPMREPLKPADPEVRAEESILFGEKSGEGESIASIDLPGKMQSDKPYDFEQAWLRQHPALATASNPEQSSKKSSALVPSGIQVELPTLKPKPISQVESAVEAPREQRPKEERASEGRATQGGKGEERRTNEQSQASSADSNPAPQAESDVDPFANAEGVSLVGGVKARKGREIKFARPRVDLAFRAEFTRLQKRKLTVGFRITTDQSGRPCNVEVIRSSGSEQIDESLRLALYDSWFGGKMPDEFPFAVRFYE